MHDSTFEHDIITACRAKEQVYPEHDRTFPFETVQGCVWIKRAAKDYRNRLQRMLACCGPPDGGINEEVRCMRAVGARGFVVPTLLHCEPAFMVLSDLGPTLHDAMYGTDHAQRCAIVARAAKAVSALHGAAGWHGNATLRNMADLGDGRLGFMDFEATARPHWSLRQRQAFDLFQLLAAAARFDLSGEASASVMAAYGDNAARRYLRHFAYAVLPLYLLLLPFKPLLKRDIAQILVSVSAAIAKP